MADNLLFFIAFLPVYRPKIWSNDPIERLNRETRQSTNVVSISPNDTSAILLVGTLLVEINDDMATSDHSSHGRRHSRRPP